MNVCFSKDLIYMIYFEIEWTYGICAGLKKSQIWFLKTLQKPACAVRLPLWSFTWFILFFLQMVHIFASETNHFPPIKALFELVTSVTLNIFQQGRHAGNNQLQRVKEIMWFWCLYSHFFLLFACICFFKPAHTETEFRNEHVFETVLVFWKGVVTFDPVILFEIFTQWVSHTHAQFKGVFTLEFLIWIRMHSVLFTPGINRHFVWSDWLTGE